ncbi:MAG: hypothetical protein K6E30_00845 [Lachnospiraceae bacterium]|nr:hypothetical protein [Lachnospiraceae bacterium]
MLSFDSAMKMCLDSKTDGFIINPWGQHFLQAMSFARNNEKEAAGVVINAFSEAFVVPRELFGVIERMGSGVE